jgi:hypothetical protein
MPVNAFEPDQREMSADQLPCHICGYDLRAHPHDGKCPECGASVAESRRLAAIPRRPAWRDSDPRWRRRLLVGTWVLVLLPLMDALQAFGWAAQLPVPTIFYRWGAIRTLDDTLVCSSFVYQPLVFCIGVVLLFSKERGRRRNRLDWTRRWGVICSYVVLVLCAAQVLLIVALVMAGIAALFQSMSLKYQPGVTQLFVELSTGYLRYGAYPKDISVVVLVAFSSIAILLACIPLFDALRSSGPKRVAAILLAPLALFAVMHLGQAVRYGLGISSMTPLDVYYLGVYFRPHLLLRRFGGLPASWISGPTSDSFLVEAAKWCIILGIAVWLSIAQLAARRQRKKASAAEPVAETEQGGGILPSRYP